MRDYTNLAWPEAPFGADQRPFGRRERIVMAIALDLADSGPVTTLTAAASVYLRTHRTQVVEVTRDTLNFGFRVMVAERQEEEGALLDLVDRALVRGRRHATVLASHDLGRNLDRLRKPADRRSPGVTTVREAWGLRKVRQRGMAVMSDTQDDVGTDQGRVDVPLQGGAVLQRPAEPDLRAGCILTRCVSIGLLAAAHNGLYRWDGRFPVRQVVERAAWDQIQRTDWDRPCG